MSESTRYSDCFRHPTMLTWLRNKFSRRKSSRYKIELKTPRREKDSWRNITTLLNTEQAPVPASTRTCSVIASGSDGAATKQSSLAATDCDKSDTDASNHSSSAATTSTTKQVRFKLADQQRNRSTSRTNNVATNGSGSRQSSDSGEESGGCGSNYEDFGASSSEVSALNSPMSSEEGSANSSGIGSSIVTASLAKHPRSRKLDRMKSSAEHKAYIRALEERNRGARNAVKKSYSMSYSSRSSHCHNAHLYPHLGMPAQATSAQPARHATAQCNSNCRNRCQTKSPPQELPAHLLERHRQILEEHGEQVPPTVRRELHGLNRINRNPAHHHISLVRSISQNAPLPPERRVKTRLAHDDFGVSSILYA